MDETVSIMSGDSPNAHKNDIFDFNKEGRSSPIPTTSKDIGVQNSGVVTNSVAVEDKKDKEDEPLDICCPTLNGDPDDKRKTTENEESVRIEDDGKDFNDKKEKKVNGNDKLDGVWVHPHKTKDSDQEDDDNCAVKCLYYTLQCCECSLM